MKVKKIVELKNGYSFEASILPAAIPAGRSSKDEKALSKLDLNSYLAPMPEKIYLVRVNGESMIDENILDGDLLVVDATEKPKDGQVVIASLDGEMAVKIIREIEGKIYLYSANQKFLPIEIGPFMHFDIQGVVKHVIRDLS